MTIYIDIVFLINFIIDFLLLLTINIALKRYSKIYRLILGCLVGSITLFSLFFSINKILFFIIKIILAIFICIVSFGFKNIKYTFYNVLYLFMTSIILGGFLYFLKIEFSYNHAGFIFYYEGLTINYIFLLIFSPLILYTFIKSLKALKEIKNYYYKISIVFENNFKLSLTGFLDTGNKLIDPVSKKKVIIISKKLIKGKVNIRSPMYIPYNTINNHGVLECIKPKYILIDNHKLTKYLIGLSDQKFKLNGVDCLLHYKILEDINV